MKIPEGYGDRVQAGDYVRITFVDFGTYGPKESLGKISRHPDRETVLLTYVGRYKLSYKTLEDIRDGHETHCRWRYEPRWHREFKLATPKQVEVFKAGLKGISTI